MAGEVVVDALPYIDQGYDDPGVREAALSMVEEECRRYRPTKNYLEQLPPLSVTQSTATFETPMLRRELERLNARLPPEPLSMKRYELPPPVAGRLSDVTAWTEAVDNSLAQLEHQATRVVNLELQLDYACETWRAYLEVITKMVSGAQCRLTGLRKETASVNWDRKSIQTAMGSKLRGLEQAWVQLVSHNYLLERAIAELEVEVANAQNKEKDEAIESEQPEPPKVKELLDSAIDKAYGVEASLKKEPKKRPLSSKSTPINESDEDDSESSDSKKMKSDQPNDIFAE